MMKTDILTIILGFIEGFALITSPCILPILPIFLAGSLTNSKIRPLGIIFGFTFIFAIFAYFSRQFVHYSGIDLNLLRYLSYVILGLLGIIMMSSHLTKIFASITQFTIVKNKPFSGIRNPHGGFISGFLFGGLLAIVWTPCAGPILATIIVQTVMQQTTVLSFFTLLAFAFGAGLPMLFIVFYGQQLLTIFDIFKIHSSRFRKILGAVILGSVLLMIYQEKVYSPSEMTQGSIKTSTTLQKALWFSYPSPAIAGIESWINSDPLSLNNLKGNVVLVDFWTYSCINCIRTLPYLNKWYQEYRQKGLIIIGVHTPEFEFEKNLNLVKDAVNRYDIHYPVALDNQFITWNNFSNHYWPAHYLIDKNGKVVYTHFGEGDYNITENNIRFLLGIDQVMMPTATTLEADTRITAETYLGYRRADPKLSPKLIPNQNKEYHTSAHLPTHAWELAGSWHIYADKIVSTKPGAILKLHFNAGKIYAVMGNQTARPIPIEVILDGSSFKESMVVTTNKLYDLINLKQTSEGVLQIIATQAGLEIYTLTFGN